MVDTLLVSADGTSCDASMVKMSVDFPNEAGPCQRFLSARAQSSFEPDGKGGPWAKLETKLLALPPAHRRASAVTTKRKKAARSDKCINRRSERRCLRGPKVIIDDKPAAVTQQTTVAIQIPTHVIVCVEDEQPDFSVAEALANSRDGCLVGGASVDQSNVVRYPEPREVLFQILDDVPAGQPEMFCTPSGFNRDDFLLGARLTRTKRRSDRGSTHIRADLEHITWAEAREVIDQEQNIRVQHRRFAPDLVQSLSHFSTAVFHQGAKQLQHLIQVRCVAHL